MTFLYPTRYQYPRMTNNDNKIVPLARSLAKRSSKLDRKPLFYGWVMLAVTTLTTMATSPGQSFIVGTFSDAIRQDLHISLSQLSAAYMIATFCASLPLTLVGRTSDRFGTRAVMTAVVFLFGLSCAFIGASTALVSSLDLAENTQLLLNLAILTLSFFCLRFLGQGALGLVSSHALAMWFERKLGLAESIRHLGMPLAVAVLPAAILALIETAGWRVTYALLGACVWAIAFPLIWLAYVNRPEDINQNIDGDATPHPHTDQEDEIDIELDAPSIGDAGLSRDEEPQSETAGSAHQFTLKQAMRTRAYWIATASMMLSAAVGTAFVFHIQPMVAELGLSKSTAAAAVGTLGVVSLIVTIPFGHLVDRIRPRMLLAATGLTLALACICYVVAAHTTDRTLGAFPLPTLMLHAAFMLLGLSQGLLFVLASPIFARYYGRKHHGAIRGSVTTFMVIGTSAGPFVFSFWRDFSGSFNQVFIASAVAALILGVWATRLKRPAR